MKTKRSLRIIFSLLLAFVIASSAITLLSSFNSPYSKKEIRQETNVYICISKNAVAYHINQNCRGLNKCSHEIRKVVISEAKGMGYRACKICSR